MALIFGRSRWPEVYTHISESISKSQLIAGLHFNLMKERKKIKSFFFSIIVFTMVAYAMACELIGPAWLGSAWLTAYDFVNVLLIRIDMNFSNWLFWNFGRNCNSQQCSTTLNFDIYFTWLSIFWESFSPKNQKFITKKVCHDECQERRIGHKRKKSDYGKEENNFKYKYK